jgi:hypothetical protein
MMVKMSQSIGKTHTVEVTLRSRYELIAMPKYGTNLFAVTNAILMTMTTAEQTDVRPNGCHQYSSAMIRETG